jgi:hypothetical protein
MYATTLSALVEGVVAVKQRYGRATERNGMEVGLLVFSRR